MGFDHLNNVCFSKNCTGVKDHGYVVGDSGIIRRTDNGGALWQTVLPEINAGGGIPDFKTVWTTSAGHAILGGTGNFFGQCYVGNTGRNFNSSAYRYGFNRKEKDDEIYGNGNEYSYLNRFYDPRLGRFLSIDRKASSYPFLSPYQFAGNSPILYLDKDGK